MCEYKSLVSLTFDDGRREQYSKFYPILEKHELKATFYVVTERIGWKGIMGWDELRVIHRDGNEIGSHTHTHRHLTTLPNDELEFEFKKSKDVLRPFNCCTLAYPYGEYDERVVEEARKYYSAARGCYNPNISDKDLELNLDLTQTRYKLKNFPIEQTIPSSTFEALQNCSLFALPFSKFKQTLKEILEYHHLKKAWIIFTIHGSHHWKNISWILRKPKEIAEHFAIRLTKPSTIPDFTREKVREKDTIQKFKWMCEYIVQNDQIKVLPVTQVIKKYLAN